MKKVPVGISSCLIGEKVRYDGGHRRDAYIADTLANYFDFRPFCPEMGIGLGAPRPTLQLAKVKGRIRCIQVKNRDVDVTDALCDYATELTLLQNGLCGYIFKSNSPSCGMERVKVYDNNQVRREGVGVYAQEIMRLYPLLPIEEEGRLGDSGLRENFIQRVYVFYRWQQMLETGLSVDALTHFHARHKLIIMSHADYHPLGRLAASACAENLSAVAAQYILLLMTRLKKIATRPQHVNVLQHIQGYLKKQLTMDETAELCEVIEAYRRAELPLVVPITLLKHHFRKTPDPYIEQSYYMSPYPQELNLLSLL